MYTETHILISIKWEGFHLEVWENTEFLQDEEDRTSTRKESTNATSEASIK